jgi:hypothetical protein
VQLEVGECMKMIADLVDKGLSIIDGLDP